MDGEEAFATASDYAARYGEAADAARVGVLLADASAMLASAYEGFFGGRYERGAHAAFDRCAPAVACAMVNRVLCAPAAMAGATQFSQGAGGYTASVSYGSGAGDMYVARSELKRLGLAVQRARSLRPAERGEAECS